MKNSKFWSVRMHEKQKMFNYVRLIGKYASLMHSN